MPVRRLVFPATVAEPTANRQTERKENIACLAGQGEGRRPARAPWSRARTGPDFRQVGVRKDPRRAAPPRGPPRALSRRAGPHGAAMGSGPLSQRGDQLDQMGGHDSQRTRETDMRAEPGGLGKSVRHHARGPLNHLRADALGPGAARSGHRCIELALQASDQRRGCLERRLRPDIRAPSHPACSKSQHIVTTTLGSPSRHDWNEDKQR